LESDGISSEEDDKLWTDIIGVSDEKKRTLYTRTIRVIVPLFLKLLQGIFVTTASFFIIVCSFDIIDLLKDYTALVVLSEIDKAAFYMVDFGYLDGRPKKCLFQIGTAVFRRLAPKMKTWKIKMML